MCDQLRVYCIVKSNWPCTKDLEASIMELEITLLCSRAARPHHNKEVHTFEVDTVSWHEAHLISACRKKKGCLRMSINTIENLQACPKHCVAAACPGRRGCIHGAAHSDTNGSPLHTGGVHGEAGEAEVVHHPCRLPRDDHGRKGGKVNLMLVPVTVASKVGRPVHSSFRSSFARSFLRNASFGVSSIPSWNLNQCTTRHRLPAFFHH